MFPIAHAVCFGVLTSLFCLLTGCFLKNRFAIAIIALSLTGLWSGITEGVQIFSEGRIADWHDFYFNMLGAGLVILGFLMKQQWYAMKAHGKTRYASDLFRAALPNTSNHQPNQ